MPALREDHPMTVGHSFRRGLKILFIERRVPWIATQLPSLVAQGVVQLVPFLRTRTCNKGGLSFEYRPATPDLQVLDEVVERDDYHILQTLESDAVVIDIGAHLGSFSVLAAAHAPTGIVLSYEPDSANFRL
jgi:hypothetical protein